MKLRKYQQDIVDQIYQSNAKRTCVQAATGAGKTVIFSHLAKEHTGRTLIFVDSEDLVKQTANHIEGAGTFEAKNKIIPDNNIVICMAQTVNSRLKKNPELLQSFDLIIIDECHILVYIKTLDFFHEGARILGFTATPIHNKKEEFYFCYDHKIMSQDKNECCKSKKIEFTKDFRLGNIFEDLIVGIPIKELIEQNWLVKEENYVIPLDDSQFDLDSFGEVKQSSADKVFDTKYQMDVLGNYMEYCQGKKTMIFTQNTTLNLLLYNQFVEAGVENCFMYDSVNDTEFTRSETVDKFRDTDGAILFNVGVFTKGFDVKEVETIIVSRRVSSLSLWIQIVGRGSRTTDKIYKDKFIVIDGGTNIERLGRWSDEYDWRKLFAKSEDFKPKKEPLEENPAECENCGEFMEPKTCICNNCNFNNCEKTEQEIIFALGVQIDFVKPDADKIVRYCEAINKDKFFAFKILTNQIIKMFRKVDKEQFEKNLNNGVERVLRENLKPNYLKIIRSGLPSKSNRTYAKQKDIVLTKLIKGYEIQ